VIYRLGLNGVLNAHLTII